MKLKTDIRNILKIIPALRRRVFWRLLLESIGFGLLDLLSIAYLIPVLLLLLVPTKLAAILDRFGIDIALDSAAILGGVVLLVVIYAAKNLLQVNFNNRFQQFLYATAHELSSDSLRQFLYNDYRDFQGQEKGAVIRNTVTVARDFAVCVLGSALILMSESVLFLLILAALLTFYFKLTLAAVAIIGLFSLIIYKLKRSDSRLIGDTYKTTSSKANAEMLNIIDGYIEIKTTGNGSAFLNRFETENKKLNRVTAILNASSGNYQKYLEVFLVTGIGGLVLYSIYFKNTDTMLMIAVLAAIGIRIIPSLGRMMTSATLFNSHFYTVAILNARKQPDVRHAVSTFGNGIELRDLKFGYTSEMVLENLELTIKPGTIIGIKGETGAGKTTLLHILAGLMAPNSGEIVVDGKTMDRDVYFPFVGYVPQQPFLFNGTIYENITMLDPINKSDRTYINYLIENLQLSEVIARQPHGIDTLISHNTSKLSGGQKQRIALLRALYHKPKLLILDEATNQQNDEMEQAIFEFLRELVSRENMAILIVSHHNALERFCDEMYEFKNKRLDEIGIAIS